jgi:hypothetical protein
MLEDELNETLRRYSRAKPKPAPPVKERSTHPLMPAARKPVEKKPRRVCGICGQPSLKRYCCLPDETIAYLDMSDGHA